MRYPTTLRRSAVPIAALALSLATLTPAVAYAQTGESETGSAEDLIVGSSRSPLSGGSSLDVALSSLDAVGSSDFTVPEALVDIHADYPKPIDDTITEPAVISIVDDRQGIQRWTVASPAMSRHVELQVLPAADPDEAAPILFLLDGFNAPRNSGWVSNGNLAENFLDDNVTLVMPTEARASMYVDWYADDLALGRNQWETFLAQELPGLLEGAAELNANGRLAVGGLSMGASGAVTLANANPGVFDAAIGISGCYSTTSPAGRMMSHGIVESRGGDSDNLYGPADSGLWERYDVVADPEGLRNMPVYLSATRGAVSAEDELRYTGDALDMALGVILEQGAERCTRELDSAMRGAGMAHQHVEILDEGAHNWTTFSAQLAPAWDHVKGDLY